jgi:hypothetical protein
VHQRIALHVVQEEIAVVAIAERGKDALGLLAGGDIVAAGLGQVRNGVGGQGHVMLELGLLAGQISLLDRGALLLGQQFGLVAHGQRDRAQRQDQRRDGQENDFCRNFIAPRSSNILVGAILRLRAPPGLRSCTDQ